MLIIEALGALQFLKKELITFSDIADALGVSRGAVSNRYQKVNGRSNLLKPDEIEKINNYYDVDLNAFVEKNAQQSPSAIDKDEVIKIVEDYLTKRSNELNR